MWLLLSLKSPWCSDFLQMHLFVPVGDLSSTSRNVSLSDFSASFHKILYVSYLLCLKESGGCVFPETVAESRKKADIRMKRL